MQWQKASEDVIEAFDAALPADDAVQKRKMFGNPSAFVNGNMFAGVFEDDIVVRLPAERRAELVEQAGAQPFAPGGRVMREYLIVPPVARADRDELARWLDEAFRFVASMPAKEAKPRKKKSG